MIKFKKIQMTVLLFLIFIFSLSMPVYANAPMPADSLLVYLSNLPEDVVYADLLIKIDKNDANYIDFQPNGFANTVSGAKEIVEYSKDGYRSFTFHYENSKSNIKIEHDNDDLYSVNFCNGLEYEQYLTQYEDLCKNYRDIKIALLDKDLNIVCVSASAKIPKEEYFTVFDGNIYYDASKDCFDIDTRVNAFALVFGGLCSIFIMVLSIVSEAVVSFLFRYDIKQASTICKVNACSQIIMRLLYIIMPFTYLIETVILEFLVYCAEFIVYRKRFKEMSVKRLLFYTVTANTISLLIGVLIDCYVIL